MIVLGQNIVKTFQAAEWLKLRRKVTKILQASSALYRLWVLLDLEDRKKSAQQALNLIQKTLHALPAL